MRKLKLFMTALALVGGVFSAWATDYLTDFSSYTVTKTAVSNDNTSGTAREFWRNGVLGFDVNGESTTLSNGVYSFSVQAVYRGHLTKDIPTGIIAYAESDGAQYMTPICNYTDGTVESASLGAFATAFETADNYLNTIPYIIVTDGKIKVGVKSMSTQPYCDNGMWFIFNTASFKVSDVTDGSVLDTALDDIKAQAAGLLASNSDESTERSNLQSAHDGATATAEDIVNVKQKIDAYLAYLVNNSTVSSPKDVSYYFTNPKYSIRNLDLVGGLVTSGNSGSLGQPFGWTCFDAGGNVDNGSGNKFQEGQGFNWFSTIGNTTAIDGHTANYDAEKSGGYSIYQRIAWNQWAEQTHSAKQTVTLPAGKYKISVPAYASAKNDDYKGYVIFNVNGTEYSNEVTASSWNVYEKEFTLTETREVSVDLQFNKLRRAQNVASQYAFFDGVTLLSYGDPIKAKKAELEALQATIDDDYLNNSTYNNVVGTERTALSGAKTTTAESETIEAYETAISSVQAAIDAFVAAKTNYDALAAEIVKSAALGFDGSEYAATSSTTSATALSNTQALKVDEYNFVTTTYQYGVDLGAWTTEGYTADNSGQHWDNTNSSKYKEQENSWDTPKKGYAADSWSIKFYQSIELPAGNYVFKVAGRKASGSHTTMSLDVTKTSDDSSLGTINDFPEGDTGLGINTSGATDFTTGEGHEYANSGNGRGWEWRYVKFTLSETTEVKIAVNADADATSQWMSFCNYTLQTDNETNISLIEYNIALSSAQTIIADDTYANVTGSEKTDLQAAIVADTSLDKNDKSAIDAATTTLNDAIDAFTGAKSNYDAYVAAKAVVYPTLSYATAAKRTALDNAQSAAATSASDADTKTAAIQTAARQYYESHALAENVTGAENKTDLISDPNFAGVTVSGTTAGGWTFDQTGGNAQVTSSESFTDGSDNSSYSYFDYYNGSNNNQNIHQVISGLAPGRYMLTATGRGHSNFNNNLQLYVVGKGDVKIPAIGNTGGVFNRGWNDASLEFYQTEEGDITIGAKTNNNKSGWWGVTRFRLVRLGDAAEEVKVTDAGFATYVPSHDLNFSETSIKAYKVKVSKKGEATLTKVDNVPASTPVLLYADGGATENIPMMTGAAEVTDNDLVAGTGDEVATIDGEYTNMILNKVDNNIGFYFANGQTVAANRAYLHIATSLAPDEVTGARMTMVFVDETQGISAVGASESKAEGYYNLSGQRVAQPTKGLYIVNGKKVIIK